MRHAPSKLAMGIALALGLPGFGYAMGPCRLTHGHLADMAAQR